MTLPPFHLHLSALVVLGALTVAYRAAAARHERRTGEGLEARRRRLFVGGVAALFVAATWPLHDLAEGYLYSAHMVQHMLFVFLAAPLLVAGTPPWMWRDLLRPAWVRAIWSVLTRPLVALLVANGVLLFLHWPEIVRLSVTSELAHFSLHALLLGSSILMWWPVLSPLPEFPALSPPGQMLYLFLQSLAPTIPASFLTLGSTLLYPVYGTFPRIWGISAHSDQLVAGLIMKLAGGAILWGFITVIFFRWHDRERQTGWDPLQLRQVEREVASELSKR